MKIPKKIKKECKIFSLVMILILILFLMFYTGNDLQDISRFSEMDYKQHQKKLLAMIPEKGFSVLRQKPFFIISDEKPETVRFLSDRVVKWAVVRLKNMYFNQDPVEIIDIWLFKNQASYQKHTWAIFGEKPDTPFGFYSETHRALIMNISTGTGTLVHEIVHPFMKANFPQCPSWFNEGLASLYEQCTGDDARIVGLTNWRLPELQRSIKFNRLDTLESLIKTGSREFYHDQNGIHYAQARYLCYFLQQYGLLVNFFHEFKKNVGTDHTGIVTLLKVLKEKDLTLFEKKWRQYILKLTYYN